MAQEITSLKKQSQFSLTTMRQYWFLLSPKKLLDQPETLSTSCYGVLKIIYLTEFSIDCLTDAFRQA